MRINVVESLVKCRAVEVSRIFKRNQAIEFQEELVQKARAFLVAIYIVGMQGFVHGAED